MQYNLCIDMWAALMLQLVNLELIWTNLDHVPQCGNTLE